MDSALASSGCTSSYPWYYQTMQRRRRREEATSIEESQESPSSTLTTTTAPTDARAAWTYAADLQSTGHNNHQLRHSQRRELPQQQQPNQSHVSSSSVGVRPEPVSVNVRRPSTSSGAVGGGRTSTASNSSSTLSLHHQRNTAVESPRRSSAVERRSCADFRWLQTAKAPALVGAVFGSVHRSAGGGSSLGINGCASVGRRPISVAAASPSSSSLSLSSQVSAGHPSPQGSSWPHGGRFAKTARCLTNHTRVRMLSQCPYFPTPGVAAESDLLRYFGVCCALVVDFCVDHSESLVIW